jgi:hypothetical protein
MRDMGARTHTRLPSTPTAENVIGAAPAVPKLNDVDGSSCVLNWKAPGAAGAVPNENGATADVGSTGID